MLILLNHSDCSVAGCAMCPQDLVCEECVEGLTLVEGQCQCKQGHFLTEDDKCQSKFNLFHCD